YGPRSGRAQYTCARVQGRSGGRDVVHQQDRFAFETRAKPAERVLHVLEAPQPVAADLGRCGTRTYEFSVGCRQRHALAKLGSQQLRLVVSTLAKACAMQWDRDHAPGGQAFDREALGDELSERTGKTSPALVLEPMHRLLDRPFVRDRGPQPRERPQPGTAPTLTPGGFNLHPAVSAQRLLQVPDFRAARVAKPSAQPATSATPRRQHEIKKRHMVSVCKRVNVLLTG